MGKYDDPKLNIEIVPDNTHGKNVRSAVCKPTWDIIRRDTYKKYKYKCAICGHTGLEQGFDWPVECHEIWKYDYLNCNQVLVGLQALCPYCHMVKHYARTCGDQKANIAFLWLCHVNGWTNDEGLVYVKRMKELYMLKGQLKWRVNIDYITNQYGVLLDSNGKEIIGGRSNAKI